MKWSKRGYDYYFKWNDGVADRYYHSDSLLNSFRWYASEKSPMSNFLEKDKDFFNLSGSFKNYIDFFFLQDIVSEDYEHVKCLFGNRKHCDDFFKSTKEVTIPATIEEYMQWHDNTIEFAEKRNKRMAEWINKN